MASVNIEVLALTGNLSVVSGDDLQYLAQGQVLEVATEDAVLLVGEGSTAVVLLNGVIVELGENASLDLASAAELNDESDVSEQMLAEDSITAVLEALEGDQDLFEVIEEPAAGTEGGDGGDGHSFVRLLRISESIDSGEFVPAELVQVADEFALVAPDVAVGELASEVGTELDAVAANLTVTADDSTDGNLDISGTSTDVAENGEVTITITDQNG
ncbi:retention module-containing protein, partial [Marinobacter vinifirmus]